TQNVKGLAASNKDPSASKDGVARRLIEICSQSPFGDCRRMMSMSRPGKRALALVASISLFRLYVRSGIGLYHLRAPIPSRWAPTCRDRLIDYRSLFPAMKARRLAATTMAAPCGRTEPRLLVGAQSHSPDGRKRTIALARHV